MREKVHRTLHLDSTWATYHQGLRCVYSPVSVAQISSSSNDPAHAFTRDHWTARSKFSTWTGWYNVKIVRQVVGRDKHRGRLDMGDGKIGRSWKMADEH